MNNQPDSRDETRFVAYPRNYPSARELKIIRLEALRRVVFFSPLQRFLIPFTTILDMELCRHSLLVANLANAAFLALYGFFHCAWLFPIFVNIAKAKGAGTGHAVTGLVIVMALFATDAQFLSGTWWAISFYFGLMCAVIAIQLVAFRELRILGLHNVRPFKDLLMTLDAKIYDLRRAADDSEGELLPYIRSGELQR